MTEPYQPLYKWRRTKIDEDHIPADSDWMAHDGDVPVGRIQLQPHGPMKGLWLWSGHGPRVRKRHTPHQGYEPEGREAMRKVEEYYHQLLENNGIANIGRRPNHGNQPPE